MTDPNFLTVTPHFVAVPMRAGSADLFHTSIGSVGRCLRLAQAYQQTQCTDYDNPPQHVAFPLQIDMDMFGFLARHILQ